MTSDNVSRTPKAAGRTRVYDTDVQRCYTLSPRLGTSRDPQTDNDSQRGDADLVPTAAPDATEVRILDDGVTPSAALEPEVRDADLAEGTEPHFYDVDADPAVHKSDDDDIRRCIEDHNDEKRPYDDGQRCDADPLPATPTIPLLRMTPPPFPP